MADGKYVSTLSGPELDAALREVLAVKTTVRAELQVAKDSGEFNGKSAYAYAQDGGFIGTEKEFADKLAINPDWVPTKVAYGGDALVISEQTLTSGIWSKLQMLLQPGIIYAVIFNGEKYVCEARADGSGVELGNNTSLTLNDYPFCIKWSGGSATSGMFFKRSDVSYPVTLKVTEHSGYVYNKMPEGYLPDGVVKSVNGIKPDENGNVQLSSQNANGLSDTARALLITVLRNGVYTSDQSAIITALEKALASNGGGGEVPDIPDEPINPEVALVGITATYSGGAVTEGTALTDLTGISVLAVYSDGSTATVTGYTLSGTIAEGSNTITVSYGGMTTTFTVTGTTIPKGIIFVQGSESNLYLNENSDVRVCAVQTEGDEVIIRSTGGKYCPIDVPNGATTMIVTCPGYIPGINLYNISKTKILDSGWLSGGSAAVDLTSYTDAIWATVNFKNPTNTKIDMTTDFASIISITFE